MKYCTKCGASIPDVSKFCPKCGASLNSSASGNDAETFSESNNNTLTKPQTSAPGKKPAALLIGIAAAILAVLLIAAAIFGIFVLRGDRHDAPEPTPSQTAAHTPTPAPSKPVGVASTSAPAPAKVSVPPQPVTDVTYYVTGVDSSLKVRQAPDGNSPVQAKLENGDGVKILDSSGTQYWKVSVVGEDVSGYIDRNYITDELSAVTEPVTYYVVNTPAYLSVLDIPAASGYQELIRAYNGDSVKVLAKPDGYFWYVYYSGTYGYALKDYLSATTPTPKPSPTPTATPTPTPTPTPVPTPSLSQSIGVAYVHVDTGYLILRNGKDLDHSKEIGQMYAGEAVYVFDTTGTYWHIYSPTLDRYGYANSNYLKWTPPTAAPTPTPESSYFGLTGTQYKTLNTFLSNFSETYMDSFTPAEADGANLLRYVYLHYKINDASKIGYSDGYYTMDADQVDSCLTRFFGISLPRCSYTGPFTSFDYADGIYSTPAADGDAFNYFSIVTGLYVYPDGTKTASFDIYALDIDYYHSSGMPSELYALTPDTIASSGYRVSYVQSGEALIRDYTMSDRSANYQLLQYTLLP